MTQSYCLTSNFSYKLLIIADLDCPVEYQYLFWKVQYNTAALLGYFHGPSGYREGGWGYSFPPSWFRMYAASSDI